MDIATWNVNSLRMRLPSLLTWLRSSGPDIVCLQETKVEDEEFPSFELMVAGYETAFWGEPNYNGVGILSRLPIEDVRRGLPGDEGDPTASRRLLTARIGGLTVMTAYVPNGQAIGTDKHAYKMTWLDRLARHLEADRDPAAPLILCGDFNIAPEDRDVFAPDAVRGSIMFSEGEHEALRRILRWGFADTLRIHTPDGGLYSYFDYRTAALHRNEGWRIDLILATAPLAAVCSRAWIDLEPRRGDRPSDHTPALARFDLERLAATPIPR